MNNLQTLYKNYEWKVTLSNKEVWNFLNKKMIHFS